MKKRNAILFAQALSYGLIITFIFADANYNLTGFLRESEIPINLRTAFVAACLIGIVGASSVWMSWHYSTKADAVTDMLTVCAWTHCVKTERGWVSLETFFSENLGYAVSHGLCDAKFKEMRSEIDSGWKDAEPRREEANADSAASAPIRELGMRPVSKKPDAPIRKKAKASRRPSLVPRK